MARKLSDNEANARLRLRIAKNIRLEDSHHIWQGQIFDGAPVIKARGTYLVVRRILASFLYKVKYEDLPMIRRTCNVHACVNPAHFQLSDSPKKE